MDLKKYLIAGGVTALMGAVIIQEFGGDKGADDMMSLANVTASQRQAIEIQKAEIGDEILSMREPNIEVRKAGNGQFQARVYQNPKYYLDSEDSLYKPIDLTVNEISGLAKLNPLKTHDKYVDAGNYAATWFDEKAYDYTFHVGDWQVKYTAQFDTANVRFQTIPQNNGVKQNVILLNKAAVNIFNWSIETNALASYDDMQLVFRNPVSKDVLFTVPQMTVFDKTGNPIRTVQYYDKNILSLILDIPEDAEYPIIIDPTTTIETVNDGTTSAQIRPVYTSARDTVASDYARANAYTALTVGQILKSNKYSVYRAHLNFPISSSLNISQVSACSLYLSLKADSSLGTNFEVNVGIGTQAGALATSWYNDFYGWVASGYYTNFVYCSSVGWNTSNFTKSEAWINIPFNVPASIDSIESEIGDTLRISLLCSNNIIGTAPDTTNIVKFYSSNAGGFEPYLSMTFTALSPTNFTMTAIDQDSILCAWTDNITGETRFRIRKYSDNSYVDSTSGANISTLRTIGKSASPCQTNTKYAWYVEVVGGTADGSDSNADSCYTLAVAPAVKLTLVYNVTGNDTLKIPKPDTTGTGNPSYTEYAIQDSILGWYVDFDANPDTLKSTAVWKTIANMADTIRIDISDYIGKKMAMRWKARSGM